MAVGAAAAAAGATPQPAESASASEAAINAQKAMLAESLRLNVIMGWLQMAMGLSSKISGR